MRDTNRSQGLLYLGNESDQDSQRYRKKKMRKKKYKLKRRLKKAGKRATYTLTRFVQKQKKNLSTGR